MTTITPADLGMQAARATDETCTVVIGCTSYEVMVKPHTNQRRPRRTRVFLFVSHVSDETHRQRIACLRKLTDSVLCKLGKDYGRLRWEQDAGCQCGCSPGFVTDDWRGDDIFITEEHYGA